MHSKIKMLPIKDFWTPICPICSLPLKEEAALDPFTGDILLFKFSCTVPTCSYFTFLSIDTAFNKDSLLNLIEDGSDNSELPKR